MDDPWGSPWADEVQQQTPVLNVGVKENPEIPDAPARQEPLSPWADDDGGFGDWAEEVVEDASGATYRGIAVTEDAWEEDQGKEKSALGSAHLHGTSLPWDDTIGNYSASESKSNPSIVPNTFATPERTVTDLWDLQTQDEIGGADGISSPPEARYGSGDSSGDINLKRDDVAVLENSIIARLVAEQELCKTKVNEFITDDKDAEGQVPTIKFGEVSASERVPVVNPEALEVQKKATSAFENENESSRPSSSRSAQSHQDDPSPESPRTSLDEPKRPQASRQVSSKIQELVEHFDGLAKTEDVGASLVTRQRNDPASGNSPLEAPELADSTDRVSDGHIDESEEDNDDFGDFEEGLSDNDEEGADTVRPSTSPPSVQSPVVSASGMKKDHGRVEFGVGSLDFGKLFPEPEKEVSATVFIPDVVPHDSFTSVEERKTWYRLSRYGTMRKHNAGDDENFVRVNWPKSQIRTDTLKIVARWMEEDRISGRVVLGGTSKGSSLFGWNDVNATPVPIESAFAAKHKKKGSLPRIPTESEAEVPREWPKGLVRTPSVPKRRSTSNQRRRSSTRSSKGSVEVRNDLQLQLESNPMVASFGWSEAKPDTKAPAPSSVLSDSPRILSKVPTPRQPPVLSRPPMPPSITVPSTLDTDNKRGPGVNNGPSILSPISGTPVAARAPEAIDTSIDPDDDDEWGEMMSTPATPVLPVMQTLPIQHKKQSSVTGDFSPHIRSPLQSSFQPPQPQLGYQQAALPSLENVLLSKSPDHILAERNVSALALDSAILDIISPEPSVSMNNPFQPPEAIKPQSSQPDPWASADFSFFDSPPKPPPKSAETQIPTAQPPKPSPKKNNSTTSQKNVASPFPRPISRAISTMPQSHTIAGAPVVPPLQNIAHAKSDPSSSVQKSGRTSKQLEEDEIVANFVKALPDLSYMFR